MLELLVLLVCVLTVKGMPYLILDTTSVKCVRVDVSAELVVTVAYDAPDLLPTETYTEDQTSKNRRKEGLLGHDLSITLTQKEDTMYGWPDKNRKRSKTTGTRKLRKIVDTEQGTLDFYTGNTAGLLEICVQSYKATPSKPRRIGLSIKQRAATVQERTQNAPIAKEQENIPDNVLTNSILTVETSYISVELENMDQKLVELASQSARSKDMEHEFHSKSIHLNKAVQYWPIFRIVVVVFAGLVQAHLVVSYMKSKHIY